CASLSASPSHEPTDSAETIAPPGAVAILTSQPRVAYRLQPLQRYNGSTDHIGHARRRRTSEQSPRGTAIKTRASEGRATHGADPRRKRARQYAGHCASHWLRHPAAGRLVDHG